MFWKWHKALYALMSQCKYILYIYVYIYMRYQFIQARSNYMCLTTTLHFLLSGTG